MKVEKLHNSKKLTLRFLLLGIPALVAGAYVLWYINQFYTVLNNKWISESIYFAAGLLIACVVYTYRFRFITTLLLLLLLFSISGKLIGNIFTGEFSAFYASANFYIFSFLFLSGWIAGWGFTRFRYFPVIISALLLTIQVIVVSKTTDINAQRLIIAFAPVLVFALYIIYIAEIIRNMNDDETGTGWFIARKLSAFILLMSLLLWMIFSIFKKEFTAIEKEFGGGGSKQEKNKESLTKENKDGSVSNKKEMGMSEGRRSSKRLVFIAKLDNFLPGTEIPNPLYFTYDYYTKFDTLTQTLEVDSLMPSNDLFQPDPSAIPLYFTQSDSQVLIKAKGTLLRKVVTAEVYKSLLSPSEYLAPSTAFFCQPIAVEKEYQQQFKSAYRAKMLVSDLNSAYFIYNPAGDEQLEKFQQQRFKELRKVNSWEKEDTAFMRYYTFIPSGDDFDSIRTLAKRLTRDSVYAVDKIIGIRNYFLSKDENGLPLFKYSDNPGVPGLPSASKLNYFLFENRKGYCAYFAGATLFLLRALGLPARVATGFLTVDRSDKNKGWYWFYEDQAHAWVQVYFPGYGWIDFDTTVPSTQQQQSPAPDGTPPITVQSAYFVSNGKVTGVDSVKKRVRMAVKKLIFHDKVFDLEKPVDLEMDVSIATIHKDTGSVSLSSLEINNEITALSFSEQFKDIGLADSNSSAEIFSKIPKPAPIDEIQIINIKKDKTGKEQIKKDITHFSLSKFIKRFLLILLLLILLIFGLPWCIYRILRYKTLNAHDIRNRSYWSYMTSLYLLNQLGYTRGNISVLQFAMKDIDPYFDSNLAGFIQIYLKTKYSPFNLSAAEESHVKDFYIPFEKNVLHKISSKEYFGKFLNFYRTIDFFIKPKT